MPAACASTTPWVLAGLWVVPDGAPADQGAYLRYPLDDLLNLIALESRRAGAVVIGEDLGVVPEGLRDVLPSAGLLGMRVLPFERDASGAFKPPARMGSPGRGHDQHP
jgi:4-alpha-glucanotransferase